jgi:hypothetical protein
MSLIAIEINNEFLDLGDTSVRYELVNPIFSTEIYQGDYSFPFTIPATRKNLKTLVFVNSLDVSDRKLEHTVSLHLYGIPRYTVKLRVIKVRKYSIDIRLSGGLKALKNIDKKLSEIDLGPDYDLGNNQPDILAKAKLAAECGDWSVYGFSFVPFSQPNFYNGNNPDFAGVVNRVNSVTGDLLANPTTGAVLNKYTLVPFIFQKYLLNKIWQAEGLTPSGTYWDDKEYSALLLYNNFAIEIRPRNFSTKVKTVGNLQLAINNQKLEFFVGPEDTYDNPAAWNTSTFEYTFINTGLHNISIVIEGKQNTSAAVPPLTLFAGFIHVWYDGAIIRVIKPSPQGVFSIDSETLTINLQLNIAGGDIGKTLYLDFFKDPNPEQVNTFFELSDRCIIEVTIDANSLPATPSSFIQFKNHVADMTVGEFLTELRKDGIMYEIDMDKAEVKMNIIDRDLEKDDAIDMTGKASVDYEMIIEDSGKGVSLGYVFPDAENAEIEIPAGKLIGEFMVQQVSEFPAPATEGTYLIMGLSNQVWKVVKDGANLNSWKHMGHNYAPFKIGNGEMKLQSKLPPMGMCINLNEGGTFDQNLALMPWHEGIGSSDLFGVGINPFDFRRVFWRGYNQFGGAENPKTGKYILANTDIRGLNRNIVGKRSFRLDKEYGMIRHNSERFYTAVSTSEIVEKEMYLEAKDFHKIKGTSKIYVDFNRFIIKSLSTYVTTVSAKAKAILLKL